MDKHNINSAKGKGMSKEEKQNRERFELATVVKVMDGDTFVVSDGRRVRLIGVDAPESFYRPERYGNQAKTYTTYKLLGKSVWLQKDVSDVDCYSSCI